MSVFLVAGEAPWDFPVGCDVSEVVREATLRGGIAARESSRGNAYQSRPPDSGFVKRKGPNIVMCVLEMQCGVVHVCSDEVLEK